MSVCENKYFTETSNIIFNQQKWSQHHVANSAWYKRYFVNNSNNSNNDLIWCKNESIVYATCWSRSQTYLDLVKISHLHSIHLKNEMPILYFYFLKKNEIFTGSELVGKVDDSREEEERRGKGGEEWRGEEWKGEKEKGKGKGRAREIVPVTNNLSFLPSILLFQHSQISTRVH